MEVGLQISKEGALVIFMRLPYFSFLFLQRFSLSSPSSSSAACCAPFLMRGLVGRSW